MVSPHHGDWAPERGDIVWLDFHPQAGHEQAGHRPALVISQSAYNRTVGLALFCPITSRAKGYPFEVSLPAGHKVRGVVLADQVKSLDWRMRKAAPVSRVSAPVIKEVLGKLGLLIGE